jgi:DNA-binding MarR family transcriptional regulator
MGSDADGAMDRLFTVAVVLGELMHRRLAEHGLTPARGEVIWLLHLRGPLTQRHLSQALKCTPRNVTGLVDALEEAGFVARTAHPTDRRATLVSLTPRGKSLVSGWGADREHTTARMFGDASAADLATFVTLLDRVLEHLQGEYRLSRT